MNEADASPRERLLSTARRLFYGEGIHTVPVDRLVTEAGVTRATFYRHFPTKEHLVEAYLRATDGDLRAAVQQAIDSADPEESLSALLNLIGHTVNAPDFRGCHFINAAAEYPDARDPVRVAIDDHRQWFLTVVTQLASNLGHPDPTYAGQVLVLLHDGALSGAQLDDPEAVRSTVIRAARELVLRASAVERPE